MHPLFLAFLIMLIISMTVSILLFFLLRDGLLELLRHGLKLDAGITFFLRSFLLLLALSGLSAAMGTPFNMKPDLHFMVDRCISPS
jgi:threonine/homoserine/homoserine lactone efflux protein